jgi:hypothetical protein
MSVTLAGQRRREVARAAVERARSETPRPRQRICVVNGCEATASVSDLPSGTLYLFGHLGVWVSAEVDEVRVGVVPFKVALSETGSGSEVTHP